MYGQPYLGAPEAGDDDEDPDDDGPGGAPSRRGLAGALPPEAYQTDASSDGEMERLASSVGISGEYRGWCRRGRLQLRVRFPSCRPDIVALRPWRLTPPGRPRRARRPWRHWLRWRRGRLRRPRRCACQGEPPSDPTRGASVDASGLHHYLPLVLPPPSL